MRWSNKESPFSKITLKIQPGKKKKENTVMTPNAYGMSFNQVSVNISIKFVELKLSRSMLRVN